MAGARFFGHYQGSIDAKKRTVLPTRLRQSVDDLTEGPGFVITIGCDCSAFMCTAKRFRERQDQADAQGLVSHPEGFDFVRLFFGNAHHVTCDAAGRIVVPDSVCEFAALKDTVVFTGVIDHIEIWNPDNYNEFRTRLAGTKYSDLFRRFLGGVPTTGPALRNEPADGSIERRGEGEADAPADPASGGSRRP